MLVFFVYENGRAVLDDKGNPMPDENVVFYKSEKGRAGWEKEFDARYQYELPELKNEYSNEELKELTSIIENSRA